MHTFENQKITVTITDSIYQTIKDSAPITDDVNELEIIYLDRETWNWKLGTWGDLEERQIQVG